MGPYPSRAQITGLLESSTRGAGARHVLGSRPKAQATRTRKGWSK